MIFWARVEHSVGSETRHDVPSTWLIVSSDRVHTKLPIAQAVPITTQHHQEQRFRGPRVFIQPADIHKIPTTNQRPLNDGPILVLTEQARPLAHERLILEPIARVSTRGLAVVEAGLKYVYGIP